MSFPTKEERTACWNARDRYWKCLEEHNLNIDNENSASSSSPCAQLRKLYQTGCPATWVKHFDRRFNYLKFKDRIEKEGYEPIDKIN